MKTKRLVKSWNIPFMKKKYKDYWDISEKKLQEYQYKFEDFLEKHFDVRSFMENYFVEGEGKKNREKFREGKLLSEGIRKYIFKIINADDFYKLCGFIAKCNPHDEIFKEFVKKRAWSAIQGARKLQEFRKLCKNDKEIQKKYFDGRHPLEQFKQEDSFESSNPTDQVLNSIKEDQVNKFSVLEKADEPIGTKDIVTKSLDIGLRDYPFVVLNCNEVIKGNSNETHTQALMRYMEQHQNDNEINKQIFDEINDKNTKIKEENGDNRGVYYRQVSKDVLDNNGVDVIAFGHVKNNMAFVDTANGCSVEDCASAIKSKLNVKKVYKVDKCESQHFINERVARLIPNYNRELHNLAIKAMKNFKH